MQQPYSEKEVLADALTAEKTATDHYNTFSNECVHENLRLLRQRACNPAGCL